VTVRPRLELELYLDLTISESEDLDLDLDLPLWDLTTSLPLTERLLGLYYAQPRFSQYTRISTVRFDSAYAKCMGYHSFSHGVMIIPT